MRVLWIAAATAAFVAAAVSGVANGSPSAVRCNLWAAPNGIDTNPGTRAAPFLTLAKLAGALTPGQTGCLPAGASFTSREVITAVGTRSGRITITTAPGGTRAILADGIETTQATRFLTLANLAVGALDASPSKNVSGTVILRGYSTALTGSDVGSGTLTEVGRSCVVLEHAGSALIDGNVLHECSGTSADRYSAGVLASVSVDARILNNVIYGNHGGDAIAFSPDAQLSRARFNLIVDNQGGIYFGGGAKRCIARDAGRTERDHAHQPIRRAQRVRRDQPRRQRQPLAEELHLEPRRRDGRRGRLQDGREPGREPARRQQSGNLPSRGLQPVPRVPPPAVDEGVDDVGFAQELPPPPAPAQSSLQVDRAPDRDRHRAHPAVARRAAPTSAS